ncbi:MAG: division plane positioning ATPase MipZ [Hyphomonadaceae bacterium]|nr:division plane positioning ATPase MipZ [Hyphomonadaceae bacterium]
MRVVTISGFKGGTGKTTVAALMGVAAVKDGLRVASLDLDRNTRNLSSFLTLRRASRLQSPDHVMLMDMDEDARTNAKPKHSGRLEPLVRMAKMDGYDLLIIDTSSGNLSDVYEAHLLADVILTPMNESPADMHGLFAPLGAAAAPRINYREMIDTVRFDRKRAGLPEQGWHVVMNRVSSLPSKIGGVINDRVAAMATEAGFEAVWRLRDRVVHRALALEGRTVFDTPSDGRLTMSELSGRSEVRALLALVQGAQAQHMPRAA